MRGVFMCSVSVCAPLKPLILLLCSSLQARGSDHNSEPSRSSDELFRRAVGSAPVSFQTAWRCRACSDCTPPHSAPGETRRVADPARFTVEIATADCQPENVPRCLPLRKAHVDKAPEQRGGLLNNMRLKWGGGGWSGGEERWSGGEERTSALGMWTQEDSTSEEGGSRTRDTAGRSRHARTTNVNHQSDFRVGKKI